MKRVKRDNPEDALKGPELVWSNVIYGIFIGASALGVVWLLFAWIDRKNNPPEFW